MTAIMGWRMRIMSPTRAAIPGRAASAGFRRLLREATAPRRRKFHHLLPNLASRQLAPFRGAVEGATEPWAGMWFSVVSPRPGPNPPLYQNGAHCGWVHPQFCSPRAWCSLGATGSAAFAGRTDTYFTAIHSIGFKSATAPSAWPRVEVTWRAHATSQRKVRSRG